MQEVRGLQEKFNKTVKILDQEGDGKYHCGREKYPYTQTMYYCVSMISLPTSTSVLLFLHDVMVLTEHWRMKVYILDFKLFNIYDLGGLKAIYPSQNDVILVENQNVQQCSKTKVQFGLPMFFKSQTLQSQILLSGRIDMAMSSTTAGPHT